MPGGVGLGPDRAIPRWLSVCTAAQRFTGSAGITGRTALPGISVGRRCDGSDPPALRSPRTEPSPAAILDSAKTRWMSFGLCFRSCPATFRLLQLLLLVSNHYCQQCWHFQRGGRGRCFGFWRSPRCWPPPVSLVSPGQPGGHSQRTIRATEHRRAGQPDPPRGRARLGKRPSGSAVLNGHVDPSSCEQQGNCRPPEHMKDGISPAPARFPHPVQYPGLAAAFPIPPIKEAPWLRSRANAGRLRR